MSVYSVLMIVLCPCFVRVFFAFVAVRSATCFVLRRLLAKLCPVIEMRFPFFVRRMGFGCLGWVVRVMWPPPLG